MNNILKLKIFTYNDQTVYLENFVFALLVMVVFVFLYLLLRKFIVNPYLRRKKVEEGRRYAINQLIKYLVYLIGFLFAVQTA